MILKWLVCLLKGRTLRVLGVAFFLLIGGELQYACTLWRRSLILDDFHVLHASCEHKSIVGDSFHPGLDGTFRLGIGLILLRLDLSILPFNNLFVRV